MTTPTTINDDHSHSKEFGLTSSTYSPFSTTNYSQTSLSNYDNVHTLLVSWLQTQLWLLLQQLHDPTTTTTTDIGLEPWDNYRLLWPMTLLQHHHDHSYFSPQILLGNKMPILATTCPTYYQGKSLVS